MIKKHFLLLTLLFLSITTFSQATLKLSHYAQVSIITSGPGKAIYEKFGHTAIRIKDPVLQLDLLYNYGMFDFDNPNFIVDFTKGYMKYKLARYPFYLALKSAQQDKRWVKEQVLNLNEEQKNAFFSFLETNVLPENASYFYDPFFNNCATKPRDIIDSIVSTNLVLNTAIVSKKASLRQLMNKEMPLNSWGSLGINIALGSKLDKIASVKEHLYLPDYIHKALQTSVILNNGNKESLVRKENILLDFPEEETANNLSSPLLFITAFSVLGLFITYKDYKNNKRTKILDFLLFFSTGSIGILIVFLWFFTNHSTAPNNFNFLWAFAPNIGISFVILRKKTPIWIAKYVQLLLVILLLTPIVWLASIQLFSYVLIPFFSLLGVRYWFLQKTLHS